MTSLEDQIVQRYTHKRAIGVPEYKRGNMDSKENEIESGFAEKFACEYLGQPFNNKITDRGDNGIDCIFKGYTVDAKWMGMVDNTTTPRDSGTIIVDLGKLRADIYIAVAGSRQIGFTILGWCSAWELMAEPWFKTKYIDKNGRKYRYGIHTSKLHHIDFLILKGHK